MIRRCDQVAETQAGFREAIATTDRWRLAVVVE